MDIYIPFHCILLHSILFVSGNRIATGGFLSSRNTLWALQLSYWPADYISEFNWWVQSVGGEKVRGRHGLQQMDFTRLPLTCPDTESRHAPRVSESVFLNTLGCFLRR